MCSYLYAEGSARCEADSGGGRPLQGAARPPGAIRCKAPRQGWHSRQSRQRAFCKLQILGGLTEFESHPLRHQYRLVVRCFRIRRPPLRTHLYNIRAVRYRAPTLLSIAGRALFVAGSQRTRSWRTGSMKGQRWTHPSPSPVASRVKLIEYDRVYTCVAEARGGAR